MTKRLASAAASFAVIGAAALAAAPGAMATANGGECQLAGTANFSPNISGTSSTITYTFSGALSNCKSGSTAGLNSTPTAGTISTPDPVSLTGTCTSSTSSGVAVVQWNDGLTTVEQYSTTGAAAAVDQSGKVIASYTSTTQKDANGNPITYTTTEPSTPVGDSGQGLLTFGTTSPQNCAPGGSGLSSASINGFVFTGSSS